eukprot:TRINITY_DN86807_c0_g1_i1.p1 TRINITY_DN86807_c0_g1~~TRINITY_DN86807_c0_g1_i1.p1  ORF type:complete len:353 (-),score=33.02 TRINITY_DN86807_c0_g1_i1:36-1046(-)
MEKQIDALHNHCFPRMSVGVAVDGVTVLETARGASTNSDTIFATASISKLFVAVMAVQCCEQGEIQSLDCDINSLLSGKQLHNPHFPDAKITLRHLLTHCSGLRDDESALLRGPYRSEGCDCPVTLQQYVDKRLSQSSLWDNTKPPGQAPYHYSNAGLTLVGHILECVNNQPLQQLAQTRIFKPLGMANTAFRMSTFTAEQLESAAVPCVGDTIIGHYGVAEFPAAGLRSTVTDLLKFANAVMQRNVLFNKDESYDVMLPKSFFQGLAWWGRDAMYASVETRKGGIWEHGGFMAGIRTHLWIWPEHKTCAVVLAVGEGDEGALLRHILGEFINKTP